MERISKNKIIKDNAIRLAEHHKEHCDGEDCNISLYLLAQTLEKAGVELTDKERLIFL